MMNAIFGISIVIFSIGLPVYMFSHLAMDIVEPNPVFSMLSLSLVIVGSILGGDYIGEYIIERTKNL